MTDSTERAGLRDELFAYANQLRRMETQAGFAGKDTSVRVKDPDFLATLLVRAGSALEARRVAELEAENARRRKALKEIAEHPENGDGFTVGWAFWNVRRIASAALKPAKIRTPAPVPTAREEG